jgi:hypothetical protein
MPSRRQFIVSAATVAIGVPAVAWITRPEHANATEARGTFEIEHTDDEWKAG